MLSLSLKILLERFHHYVLPTYNTIFGRFKSHEPKNEKEIYLMYLST